ncbi:MAG: metal-sensitive transcriptional regulator [Gammaproteobacteria bacterium]
MNPHASHKAQLNRLRRLHGQIGGLVRMVEQERYCIDILTQVSAARAALRKVEEQVLREHVEHCIAQATVEGDDDARHAKLDELMDALARFQR